MYEEAYKEIIQFIQEGRSSHKPYAIVALIVLRLGATGEFERLG